MREITLHDLQHLDPRDPNTVVTVLIPKGTPIKDSHQLYLAGVNRDEVAFLDTIKHLTCNKVDEKQCSLHFTSMQRLSTWGKHIPSVEEIDPTYTDVSNIPRSSSHIVLEDTLGGWLLVEHQSDYRYFVFDSTKQAQTFADLLNLDHCQLVENVPETIFAPGIDPLAYNVAVRSYIIVYITLPVLNGTVWVYQYHVSTALELIRELTDEYGSVDSYFKWLADNWSLPKDCTIKHWSIDAVVVSHKPAMCKS
jgi:hypothetical protein